MKPVNTDFDDECPTVPDAVIPVLPKWIQLELPLVEQPKDADGLHQ